MSRYTLTALILGAAYFGSASATFAGCYNSSSLASGESTSSVNVTSVADCSVRLFHHGRSGMGD